MTDKAETIPSLIDQRLLSHGGDAPPTRKISYTLIPFVKEIFGWIDQTFPTEQDQAVRYLTELFTSSVHNKVVATEGRVTGYIAENLHAFAGDGYFDSALAMFVELCKFSVEGQDLKAAFSYVTGKRPICEGTLEAQRARQLKVYRALITVLNSSDTAAPSKFFWLEGSCNDTSIQISNSTVFDKKWPKASVFMMWVMFDELPTKDSNFTSLEKIGFEVLLKGTDLIVRTCGGNSSITIQHDFKVGKWYHLCFFHYSKKDYLRTIPTLCVYINGVLEHEPILKLPTTSGPLSQRVIGNVKSQHFVTRTMDTTLRGGITSVAVGSGAPLAPEAVAHIYSQGPEFVLSTHYLQTVLKSSIELSFVITPHALKAISANASTSSGSVMTSGNVVECYNTDLPPRKKPSLAYSKPTEEGRCDIYLTGVKVVSCSNAKSAFFAALGVRSLVPLFHPVVLERWPTEALELAARITTAALRNDKREYIEYVAIKGSEAITGLLSLAAAWKADEEEKKGEKGKDEQPGLLERCINDGAIRAFSELGGILEIVYGTRGAAYMPLLLNFDCWLRAAAPVQHNLVEALLIMVSFRPQYYREFIGVERILAGITRYSEAAAAGAVCAEDATVIKEVLRKILEFFYLKAGEHITQKEVASLCTFVKTSTSEDDICDGMRILLKGLQSSKGALTNMLADLCDGGNFFLRLAGHESVKIRHIGIKTIGLFLSSSTFTGSQKAVVRDFPFEKLFAGLLKYRFDYDTYLSLVQLFMLNYSDDVCTVKPKGFSYYKTFAKAGHQQKVFEGIMDLLITEVERCKGPSESIENVKLILKDLTTAIYRRGELQDIIASFKGWHRRLLLVIHGLSLIERDNNNNNNNNNNPDEVRKLKDSLFTVLTTLLCIDLSAPGGWRTVEDTFLYAKGVWNWQLESEIAHADRNTDAWQGVCLRIAGQLMDFFTLLVNAQGDQRCDTPTIWANFVNLAGMIEATMFSEPAPPPSSALLKKLSPAAAASLESSWPNFGPGYLRVQKGGADEAEQWADIKLALKVITIYDELWKREEVKAAAGILLETAYGKKRLAVTTFLRLSLAVLFYSKPYFLGSLKQTIKDGSEVEKEGEKNGNEENEEKRKELVNSYMDCCFDVANCILETVNLFTGIGGNIHTLFWISCALLEVLHKLKPVETEYEESGQLLFAVVQEAAELSQSSIEAAIPALKSIEASSSTTTPSLTSSSSSSTSPSLSSSNSQQQQQQQANDGTQNEVAKIDDEARNAKNKELFALVLSHINESFDVLFSYWASGFFNVSVSKARTTITEVKTLVTEVEKKEFFRKNAALQAKLDEQAKSLGSEVVQSAASRRARQESAVKELACYEERMALLSAEVRDLNAFRKQDALRTARKAMHRIVRSVAHSEGPWNYKTGRALYSSVPITNEDYEEEIEIEIDDENENNENENENGNENDKKKKTKKVKRIMNDLPPLWKVDSFVRDDIFIKPFLRVDYSHDLQPRDKGFTTRVKNELAEKKSWDTRSSSSSSNPSSSSNTANANANNLDIDDIVMPMLDEEIFSVVICERVTYSGKVSGTLCYTARRLYFFKAGDRDGSRGFKAWPLEALRRVFVHPFALAHGLKVHVGSRLYLFEVASREECLKFAKNLVATASGRGARAVLVADGARALRKEGWTERWVRGEVTTFQYLMALNTYGGRMAGDLSRYPVFPWVLTDYASGALDLGTTGAIRDLSKPVGALNEDRLRDFLQRFRVMQKEKGMNAVLPFIYGSHYSNMGSVAFWLVRLEPVATVARELQSGTFDQADRLFFSVENAWSNILRSTSDVKELIPEFYYMGDLFRNANGYWFGPMQSGELVDDVVLPPWARGSPELFARMNAEALESPRVSAAVHRWVDLIFGFSQSGQAAVDANNLFYYLTYPERVNEAAAEMGNDPLGAQAMRVQLSYFGQCPTQLFHDPHPARILPNTALSGINPGTTGPSGLPASIRVDRLEVDLGGARRGGRSPRPLAAVVLPAGSASDPDASVVIVERTHEVALLNPFLAFKTAGRDGAWVLPFCARAPLCYCSAAAHPAHIVAAASQGSSFVVAPLSRQKSAVEEAVSVAGYGDEVTALAMNRQSTLLAVGTHKGLCTVWALNERVDTSAFTIVRDRTAAPAAPEGEDNEGSDNGSDARMKGFRVWMGKPTKASDLDSSLDDERLLFPRGKSPSMILRDQHSPVTKICFSDDSTVCATGAADGTVCVYHIEDGRAWFVAAIHPPPNNTNNNNIVNNNNNNVNNPVVSLAFTRTRSDLVILWEKTGSVHFATINGRLYDEVPLPGSRRRENSGVDGDDGGGDEDCNSGSDVVGAGVDVFVVMKGPDTEYVVVLDEHGFTFVSVGLMRMPEPRCVKRWVIPNEREVTIVGGGQIGKKWSPKTPDYVMTRLDTGSSDTLFVNSGDGEIGSGVGSGEGKGPLTSSSSPAPLMTSPSPSPSLSSSGGGGGGGGGGSGGSSTISRLLGSGGGSGNRKEYEINLFLICVVAKKGNPNNVTRQYMIASV